MRFFQTRLPFALLFCLLSCPLVSRADQTQPDASATAQSTQSQYTDITAAIIPENDDAYLFTDDPSVQLSPVGQPIQEVSLQTADPGDPSSSAVAPEPSSMVLLTTGLLLGGLLWVQQRS